MRNALVGNQQFVGVVIVEHQRAFRAINLDAHTHAELRRMFRQRVVNAEINHRAIFIGDQRKGRIIDVVTGLAKHRAVTTCSDFARPYAFKKPAGDIHPVGQHIHHRRGGGGPLENLDPLCARIAGAPGKRGDFPNAAGKDLIFCREIAPLEALGVANIQGRTGGLRLGDQRIGIGECKCNGLLNQHRFTQFQRLHHRQQMLVLAGRDNHRIDLRMRDHRQIVRRGKISPRALSQLSGAIGAQIGHRQKLHRRMRRRHLRPQRADAPGTDHRDTQFTCFHFHSLELQRRATGAHA